MSKMPVSGRLGLQNLKEFGVILCYRELQAIQRKIGRKFYLKNIQNILSHCALKILLQSFYILLCYLLTHIVLLLIGVPQFRASMCACVQPMIQNIDGI